MKTKSLLSILIIGIILVACDTKQKSAYYSHDLQMETLRGKVNQVDYKFYKDKNCNKRYSSKTPYSLVYDEKGNLVRDSRYAPFDDVERDENGFFVHVYTGNDVAPEEHTEWDMIELSYTYNEEGFVSTSFKAGMDADCGKRTYYYKDSLPSRIELGDGDGYIDYEIIKTDNLKNWTLARVDVNYNEYDMDGDLLRNVRDNYYIQRIIMYSQDEAIHSNERENVDYFEDVLPSYNSVDENEWIYGTWRCSTPYGTIEVILQDNGRMYDGIEERWHDYTIEGNRIIEQLNGGISSYNIDRANKRFDCGEPGYWFRKVK